MYKIFLKALFLIGKNGNRISNNREKLNELR